MQKIRLNRTDNCGTKNYVKGKLILSHKSSISEGPSQDDTLHHVCLFTFQFSQVTVSIQRGMARLS